MKKRSLQMLIYLTLTLLALAVGVVGQGRKSSVGIPLTPTIATGKPGVYVSFERLAKRTPLRRDENGNGVWLRLHNNMRSAISLCVSGISDNRKLEPRGESSQITPRYAVVLNPTAPSDEPLNIKVPAGYNTTSVCDLRYIHPGGSILFTVPAEHLVKGLTIRIPFNYKWEDGTEGNPSHYVSFDSYSIPAVSTRAAK